MRLVCPIFIRLLDSRALLLRSDVSKEAEILGSIPYSPFWEQSRRARKNDGQESFSEFVRTIPERFPSKHLVAGKTVRQTAWRNWEMIRIRTSAIAALVTAGALAMSACQPNVSSGNVSSSNRPEDVVQASLASLHFLTGGAEEHHAPPNTGDFYHGPRNSPPAKKWVELSVGSANGLHPIVHDGAGFTLYRFDKDTANPSKSNCNGACAVTWPPVEVTPGSKIFVAGVPVRAVGLVRRDDGNLQVTIGGWPIYRFSKDTGPGQTNGEGVGGTWFAVSPTGGKVLPATMSSTLPSTPPSTAPGSGPALRNGSAILDSGANFAEPNGSVGVGGPGCKNIGAFQTGSIDQVSTPFKIWTGPNCTGTSKLITDNVPDLAATGFTQPIASTKFGDN